MSDKPQTTRNKIRGVYTTEAEQIIFLDTPGIHKPKSRLGDWMVQTARETFEEVDVILFWWMPRRGWDPGTGLSWNN